MLPLLGLAAPTRGQERTVLRGHVVDAVSQEPLQGVHMTAPLSDLSVLTDSLGEFRVRPPFQQQTRPILRDGGVELAGGLVGPSRRMCAGEGGGKLWSVNSRLHHLVPLTLRHNRERPHTVSL